MHRKSIPGTLPPHNSHYNTSHPIVEINLVPKDELYLFIIQFCRNAVITIVYDNNRQFVLNSFSPSVKTSILWLSQGKMSAQIYVIFTSSHHGVIFQKKMKQPYLPRGNEKLLKGYSLPQALSSSPCQPVIRQCSLPKSLYFISLPLSSARAAVPRSLYTPHSNQSHHRRFHYPYKCLILFRTPLSFWLH